MTPEQEHERFVWTLQQATVALEKFGEETHEAFRKVVFFSALNRLAAKEVPAGEDRVKLLAAGLHESLIEWAKNLTCWAFKLKPIELEAIVKENRAEVLRSVEYGDYLKSAWWQSKRLETLEADGHSCRLCGSTKNLNIHHRTYENLGEEQPLDLVTLCRACHESFHANRTLAR